MNVFSVEFVNKIGWGLRSQTPAYCVKVSVFAARMLRQRLLACLKSPLADTMGHIRPNPSCWMAFFERLLKEWQFGYVWLGGTVD